MRIDAVIRKYNLQLDDQYISPFMKVSNKELRFKWTNIAGGHVLGRFVKVGVKKGSDYVSGFYRTVFAGSIEFNPETESIRCVNWVLVNEDKYEEHIKCLYKQYEEACLLKKKFQEKARLTKLERDFRRIKKNFTNY